MQLHIRRKTRLPLLAAALALTMLASVGCKKWPAQAPTTQPAEPKYSDDYVAALGAADEFCQAWKAGEYLHAKSLMTVRLSRQYPEARVKDALQDSGNPRHAAYHIGSGEKDDQGRYAFEVQLFFTYRGERADRIEAPEGQIVVAQDTAGAWRIDEFPIP